MKRLAAPFAILGAVLLIAAAGLHLAAAAPVEQTLRGSMLSPHMIALLKIVWLGAALHCIVLAAIAIAAMRLRSAMGSAILLLCALTPAIDAGILVYAVGPFAESAVLLVAAVALTVAAIAHVQNSGAASHA
jgi:uncharacterized membrane protein YhaH (DUF805 family)